MNEFSCTLADAAEITSGGPGGESTVLARFDRGTELTLRELPDSGYPRMFHIAGYERIGSVSRGALVQIAYHPAFYRR